MFFFIAVKYEAYCPNSIYSIVLEIIIQSGESYTQL